MLHPSEPAKKEAIGIPRTIPALKPLKTIDTAREDLLGSTEAAAIDIAIDQNTGWTKAGITLVRSNILKVGAKIDPMFASRNTNNTKQTLNFRLILEKRRLIHGPKSAITKAKPLSSHPA
jgi:hypothetical protein